MGSRLEERVVHFANLPINLLMPSSFTNITEIALKTIPSASKIEIKRVLESLYGFDVDKVRTLNMEGKKKKRGGLLIAKPDFKKAYVTLRNPLSISPDLYPLRMIEEEKKQANKKSKSSIVEEGETKRHWLDKKERERFKLEKASDDRRRPNHRAAFQGLAWDLLWSYVGGVGQSKPRQSSSRFKLIRLYAEMPKTNVNFIWHDAFLLHI